MNALKVLSRLMPSCFRSIRSITRNDDDDDDDEDEDEDDGACSRNILHA
jgi:hypothetical protein